MAEPCAPTRALAIVSVKGWLFLLLGITGGGLGVLFALLAEVVSWPDAKLFIVLGIAIGIAVSAVLASNLIITKKTRRIHPNGDSRP